MDLRHPILLLIQIARRARIRRVLHIQHLIISPELGAIALHTHVEQEREDGGEGAGDGEGGDGFVEATDHYAGLVVPAADYAAVAEGPG